MSTLLPRYLRAVRRFVSKDEWRQILCAVHVEPDHVVATDSYRLVRIDYSAPPASDFPTVNGQRPVEGDVVANIDGRAFMKAIGRIPTSRKSLPVLSHVAVLDATDTTVSLATTNLNESDVLVTRTVLGVFPDYRELLERHTTGAPRAFVDLNVGFLKDMAESVHEFGAEYVRIELRSPLKPAVFRAKNDSGATFTAIQMPVRDHCCDEQSSVSAALEDLERVLKSQAKLDGENKPGKRERACLVAKAQKKLAAALLAEGGAE